METSYIINLQDIIVKNIHSKYDIVIQNHECTKIHTKSLHITLLKVNSKNELVIISNLNFKKYIVIIDNSEIYRGIINNDQSIFPTTDQIIPLGLLNNFNSVLIIFPDMDDFYNDNNIYKLKLTHKAPDNNFDINTLATNFPIKTYSIDFNTSILNKLIFRNNTCFLKNIQNNTVNLYQNYEIIYAHEKFNCDINYYKISFIDSNNNYELEFNSEHQYSTNEINYLKLISSKYSYNILGLTFKFLFKKIFINKSQYDFINKINAITNIQIFSINKINKINKIKLIINQINNSNFISNDKYITYEYELEFSIINNVYYILGLSNFIHIILFNTFNNSLIIEHENINLDQFYIKFDRCTYDNEYDLINIDREHYFTDISEHVQSYNLINVYTFKLFNNE